MRRKLKIKRTYFFSSFSVRKDCKCKEKEEEEVELTTHFCFISMLLYAFCIRMDHYVYFFFFSFSQQYTSYSMYACSVWMQRIFAFSSLFLFLLNRWIQYIFRSCWFGLIFFCSLQSFYSKNFCTVQMHIKTNGSRLVSPTKKKENIFVPSFTYFEFFYC